MVASCSIRIYSRRTWFLPLAALLHLAQQLAGTNLDATLVQSCATFLFYISRQLEIMRHEG